MAKILVADDDLGSRLVLAKCVESDGHVAIHCSNGRRALDVLVDNPDIALLITDVMMPEMDGRELVQILRGNAHFAPLPIILISAVVGMAELQDLLDLGVSHFMAKPIDSSVLRRYVSEMLEARANA